MKVRILGLLLLLSLASPFVSAASPYADYIPQQQYQAPGSMLRDGLDKLISFLGQGPGQDPQRLFAFVQYEIAPYFDFSYMAQWVAGPLSRNMTPPQASAMVDRLRSMFLQAMVRELADYSNSRIQYLRPRGNPASGEVTMGIRAYPNQGYPTRLDFRMYQSEQGWKVFDVVVNGQSVVAHYRAYFAQQAQASTGMTAYPAYR